MTKVTPFSCSFFEDNTTDVLRLIYSRFTEDISMRIHSEMETELPLIEKAPPSLERRVT